MKYIRTKDGIYDLEKSLFYFFDGCVKVVSHCEQFEENSDNCKATDTIEELCDDFVVIGYEKTLRPQIIYGQNIKKFYQKNKNTCEIYGAIWTEWGLKYVAKMNEKGELELIRKKSSI